MSNQNFSYVRNLKSRDIKSRYDRIQISDDLSVEKIIDGTIIPNRNFANDTLVWGRGGVLDEHNQFCSLSGCPKRFGGYYDFDKSSLEVSDSSVIYLGLLHTHWGHFLLEGIPRLWYVIDNIDLIKEYKIVYIKQENSKKGLTGNFRELFEILGILDKIEIIDKPTKYAKIIVPEASYKPFSVCSTKFQYIFDTIIKKALQSDAENKDIYEKNIFYTIFFSEQARQVCF